MTTPIDPKELQVGQVVRVADYYCDDIERGISLVFVTDVTLDTDKPYISGVDYSVDDCANIAAYVKAEESNAVEIPVGKIVEIVKTASHMHHALDLFLTSRPAIFSEFMYVAGVRFPTTTTVSCKDAAKGTITLNEDIRRLATHSADIATSIDPEMITLAAELLEYEEKRASIPGENGLYARATILRKKLDRKITLNDALDFAVRGAQQELTEYLFSLNSTGLGWEEYLENKREDDSADGDDFDDEE